MERRGPQPVVFVGPSCPRERVGAILPGAVIAPPAKRGDLYRFRLLGFSVFLIVDGVFANTLAVSPREVVDVVEDGAAVVGTSSMGALRAADCAPAGAIGYGRVFRLFRRGVLTSEDEVAVTFNPERPWPAATEALVNVRFALRRAWRSGTLSPADALALARAAEGLPYQRREWSSIAFRAGVDLTPAQMEALRACDVKRDDALSCCRWVAARLREGAMPAGPRQDLSRRLGRMSESRERTLDPLDGDDPYRVLPDFLEWLLLSGTCAAAGPGAPDLSSPAEDDQPLVMRFTLYRRALVLADRTGCRAAADDLEQEGLLIARAHGAADWERLLEAKPDLAGRLAAFRDGRARVRAAVRDVLFSADRTAVWRRDGRERG